MYLSSALQNTPCLYCCGDLLEQPQVQSREKIEKASACFVQCSMHHSPQSNCNIRGPQGDLHWFRAEVGNFTLSLATSVPYSSNLCHLRNQAHSDITCSLGSPPEPQAGKKQTNKQTNKQKKMGFDYSGTCFVDHAGLEPTEKDLSASVSKVLELNVCATKPS